MSEIPTPGPENQPEQAAIYEPTAEELRAGLVLNPTETVAFDIPKPADAATRSWQIGNGIKVSGAAVAELSIGTGDEHATAMVINTFDAPNKREAMVILSGRGVDQPIAVKLEPGQMWGLGRSFEGQEQLPTTVSRNHCAVGMDSDYRLVIENHNPANQTFARRFS